MIPRVSLPKSTHIVRLGHRSKTTLTPLPPLDVWKSKFPFYAHSGQMFVKETSTADKIAKTFLKDKKGYPSEGKVVIEAFPGPGVLTRSLLSLPESKIKKLIVLEQAPEHLEYLKPLEECDPRIKVIPLSGFNWSTYADIEAKGILRDVITTGWDDPLQTNLHFVSHIPNNVYGDQLLAQLLRLVPERAWLFKFGRVPLSVIISETLHQRTVGPAKTKARSKLSVITEAVSEVEEALPKSELAPYKDHFHPVPPSGVERKVKGHMSGAPVLAIDIYPTEKSPIEGRLLREWDYVLRRMFVLKSTPLKKSINALGPGATNLLQVLSNPDLPQDRRVDCSRSPKELTLNDWALIVKAFDEWPFAPEDISIYDTLYKDVERD